MGLKEDRDRIHALIDKQEAILADAAELAAAPEDEADRQYRRGHGDLESWFSSFTMPCYCVWDRLIVWYWESVGKGTPDWRDWLNERTRLYRELVEDRSREPAKFKQVPYERYGDAGVRPYDKWRGKLEPYKRRMLDEAVDGDLLVLGSAAATDWTEGHFVEEGGDRLFEYKIRRGGREFGQQEICLRIWCRVKDGEVVLLNGHDKGSDPGGEGEAQDIAFKRLSELEGREAKKRKRVRRGLKA
jgi:hypothetical protein